MDEDPQRADPAILDNGDVSSGEHGGRTVRAEVPRHAPEVVVHRRRASGPEHPPRRAVAQLLDPRPERRRAADHVVGLVERGRTWSNVVVGGRTPVRARLLYSARAPDDVLYRDELARLAAADPALGVVFTLTRHAAPGWNGYRRRIDHAMLGAVAFPPAERPHVFVCGPTADDRGGHRRAGRPRPRAGAGEDPALRRLQPPSVSRAIPCIRWAARVSEDARGRTRALS